MFRTIFIKIFMVFIAVLILSFSITGTILYFSVGNFVAEEKIATLEQSGTEINEFLFRYIRRLNDPDVYRTLVYLIKSYKSNTDSIIWIVNFDGRIFFSEKDIPDMDIPLNIKEKLMNGADSLKLPNRKQYEEVMSGKGTVTVVGDLYGLFEDTNYSWLTVEVPLEIKTVMGEKAVVYSVYLSTPIPEVNRLRAMLFQYFLYATLFSAIISVIMIFILSKRITKPLIDIKKAAKNISAGEFQKRVVVKSDDEIGELAISFNNMAESLQKIEDMRREFTANVSHELRTPLTSIRGFIEGILDGTVSPDKREMYLGIVMDETNRLNRLINDLLDLTKIEMGETTLRLANFDLNELIRICIIKQESILLEKDLHVEVDFEHESCFVNADPDMIERVIINLIHNSVKFTNKGGNIKIAVSRQKEKILISEEDNGIGIDKKEINLIWGRFYKSDKSRAHEKFGSGLGLAIIRNIINLHGQEITVESELGKGTKFTFTLNEAVYDK